MIQSTSISKHIEQFENGDEKNKPIVNQILPLSSSDIVKLRRHSICYPIKQKTEIRHDALVITRMAKSLDNVMESLDEASNKKNRSLTSLRKTKECSLEEESHDLNSEIIRLQVAVSHLQSSLDTKMLLSGSLRKECDKLSEGLKIIAVEIDLYKSKIFQASERNSNERRQRSPFLQGLSKLPSEDDVLHGFQEKDETMIRKNLISSDGNLNTFSKKIRKKVSTLLQIS